MPSRSGLTAVGALAVLAVAVGCSDDETRGGGITPSSVTSSSSAVGGSGGAGGGSGGSGGAGGSGASGGSELGTIAAIDVADTACAPTSAAQVELHPNDAFAPVYARLEAVGSRRVAGHGSGIEGVITFDADGDNASAPPTNIGGGSRFASEGDTFGVAAIDGSDVVYQRYDEQGQPLGSQLAVGQGDAILSPELGGGGGESLVVFARDGALHGRGIDSAGMFAGPAFMVAPNVYGSAVRVAVARHDSGFAIAYSGNGAGDQVTSFVLASLTQLEGSPVEITRAEQPHQLLRMVKRASGYSLLVTGPFPDAVPFVIPLDDQGNPFNAYKLLGSQIGWDIAAQADQLGVLAVRPASEEPLFRPFDANMMPLGPWVCLDTVGDGGDDGALDADGTGYAAIFRRPQQPVPEGKEVFMRFNNLGTAP